MAHLSKADEKNFDTFIQIEEPEPKDSSESKGQLMVSSNTLRYFKYS
jgi:hypothetical protein